MPVRSAPSPQATELARNTPGQDDSLESVQESDRYEHDADGSDEDFQHATLGPRCPSRGFQDQALFMMVSQSYSPSSPHRYAARHPRAL